MAWTTRAAVLALLLPAVGMACADNDGDREAADGAGAPESAREALMDSVGVPQADSLISGVTIPLSSKGGSGVAGVAKFDLVGDSLPAEAGDSVRVKLMVNGLSVEGEHPAHLHAGSCSGGGGVLVPLGPVTGPSGGASTVRVARSLFTGGDLFVQVHRPNGTPVACGDLTTSPDWAEPDSTAG